MQRAIGMPAIAEMDNLDQSGLVGIFLVSGQSVVRQFEVETISLLDAWKKITPKNLLKLYR